MKYKKILITGGSGFIGSNLALKLIENGHDIVVLDNMSKQIHGDNYCESALYKKIEGKVVFIHGDVQNREDWLTSIREVDAIIHLAAETGTGQSMYEVEKYCDVNIKGTSILLDILTNTIHNVKKLIIASSRAIYGEGKYFCEKDGVVYPTAREEQFMSQFDFNVKCPLCGKNVALLPTTEDSKIHPTSIYGFTKQAQEDLCMIAGKSLNIPVVAFRYQNVYGPGQSLKNPYTGILSIFSTRILNGNDITIFEDGLESRDFVYIDDVVDATILGLEKDDANFKSFNVGTGDATDVFTVATTLNLMYENPVNIVISGNYRLGDIRHNFADITLAKKVLGFSPRFNFVQGISHFTDWVKTQQVENDNYESSIKEMKQKGLYK